MGTESPGPPPPSPPLPLVPRLSWHFSGGSVGRSPAAPQHAAEPAALPGHPGQPRHPRCTAQGPHAPKPGGTKNASELIPPARAGEIIALCSLQEAQRPLVPF